MCAKLNVVIPSSKIGFSEVMEIHEEVPSTQFATPSFTQPVPAAAHAPSPPPMTTGVPSKSPVIRAASAVTVPAMSMERFISGIFAGSRPKISSSCSDQQNSFRSIRHVEEASEKSVTYAPVRRRMMKSLALSVLKVFA